LAAPVWSRAPAAVRMFMHWHPRSEHPHCRRPCSRRVPLGPDWVADGQPCRQSTTADWAARITA
jgi:hypothetical protein